ncbi:hypothetical protein Sfulv_31430 [Streptomyces fulvorobeus]|uniref:Uncharacterized protein n=1 Tax=Streptomyces fulvorobeus TaxID=284028 RepID=A0A7J0C777_9ACTN|nr:hypothetical protein Sfulv_31430 [Streptomyces fulvorobeus]
MIGNMLGIRPFVRLESPDRTGERTGEAGAVVQARKIVLYAVSVFVLYTIITSPNGPLILSR